MEMHIYPWREEINSRRFALVDLCVVAISGAILCLSPDFWFWSLLIALIPWGFRLAVGEPPFRRTSFNWLIFVFVVSAGAGYWASYDKTIASSKFFLLLLSVVLFFALSSQPEENLVWVSTALFCAGVGISLYFFLTHDFLAYPRKLEVVNTLGRWVMQMRPSLGWSPIHPNYASGIAALMTPFILHPLWRMRNTPSRSFFRLIIAAGLAVVLLAIFMATSRGVLMAIASAAGMWVLWRIVQLNGIKPALSKIGGFRLGNEAAFPSFVLIYLAVVVIFLYWGPANFGGSLTESGYYGNGSRAEVFARSIYLVADFPLTGGGLGSYPALYSQYMLGIPYFYLPNAHNLFLDVFIEQGIPGGFVYLVVYVAGIWQVARAVSLTKSLEIKLFGWLALATLMMAFVHGMVDDYLYNGKGTILALVPVGVALIISRSPTEGRKKWMPLVRNLALATGILLVGILFVNRERIRSVWSANLGAVRMAQVELAGFPSSKWEGQEIMPSLTLSEASLLSSLQADPANRTANHRLGLIAILRQDFPTAVRYLETAHAAAPGHRGITKVLGYCYVWLGQYDKAKIALKEIPEAGDELDAYMSWWHLQGRSDLSEGAIAMKLILNNEAVRP